MSMYDFRTKPDTEWTYYVVDHLPTMTNLYRYDTVEEAIKKYNEIPSNMRSAIGSSLQNHYEIDHVHRIDDQTVLVTDIERTGNAIWRDSEEIQNAVALMKRELKVCYELNSDIFLKGTPVAIPLSDPSHSLSSYFNNKRLDPKISDRPLSGINEVHSSEHGWIKAVNFLDILRNREWTREGGYPVHFVNQINIRYVDKYGYRGQADVTPQEFIKLKEMYEKSLERKPSLDAQIYGASGKAAEVDSADKSTAITDIER